MVVKMKQIMRWPPWPPLFAVKFDVIVVVHRIEGLNSDNADTTTAVARKRPVVEIRWRGPRAVTLKRSSVERSYTEEGGFRGDGVVEWNEEFKRVCEFSVYKEGEFLPWLVSFTLFNGLNQGSKEKARSFGKASLNIAEYFSLMKEDDVQVKVPLKMRGSSSSSSSPPCLHVSLQFSSKESLPERQRSALPVLWSPLSGEAEKAESVVKVGLRKMKTFNHCMSIRQASEKEETSKKDGSSGSESRSPERNLDSESSYPFDTDSQDEADAAADESETSGVVEPVTYKTLRYANWARGSFHAGTNPDDDDLIYYSHRSPSPETGEEVSNDAVASEQGNGQMTKKRMLSWKKRKLSFRSSKQKGEPLLKKDCLEEGGDDIDYDRRQLSSSDESTSDWYRSDDSVMKPLSEFGDDDFVVGSWETRDIISRDGLMKLKAQVFLASIDQRSERAAGESACTALVAVMAHWLGSNRDIIPTRSEFDSLIREGSSEWRNLCENEEYRERFPDKHFDLETVLQAKIRPICVVPEKSFIGFFHPEEEEEEDAGLDFLKDVMSFDSIWEEIMRQEPEESGSEPVIYIVSWNDHFFVLLVDHDAYYIIDTLGERLYEGCNQAYVLKFDKEAEIQRLKPEVKENNAEQKASGDKNKSEQAERSTESDEQKEEEVEVCSRGKESCREYIKSFLAAIPIQQAKADMKKGLVSSVHHRLQIELHFTRHIPEQQQPNLLLLESSAGEANVDWSLASNSGGFGCEMGEFLGVEV
ncbi:Splicing factor 3A subunit [Hirschfeldia incana]|nr:Splicing factor 3A subunit [Hirschfeldia incana]